MTPFSKSHLMTFQKKSQKLSNFLNSGKKKHLTDDAKFDVIGKMIHSSLKTAPKYTYEKSKYLSKIPL